MKEMKEMKEMTRTGSESVEYGTVDLHERGKKKHKQASEERVWVTAEDSLASCVARMQAAGGKVR